MTVGKPSSDDRRPIDSQRAKLNNVSREMTAFHREQFGKGPSRARTYIAGFLLISVLEDVYTPAERTLIEIGELDRVRDTRLAHQLAVRGRFTELVENATGHSVIGFTSTVHFDPDLAIETFILEQTTPA